MRDRLTSVVRRASRSRRAAPLVALGAVPWSRGDDVHGAVVPEYYGMLLGRRFEGTAEAVQHYFTTGWRLGVVPNPFVDVPGAHFSLLRSLRVRNALARVSRGKGTGPDLGAPGRFAREEDALAALGGPGGWLPALVDASVAGRARVVLGRQQRSWADFLASCRELTDAAATVLAEDLVDRPFYEHQVGGPTFLSTVAALDDYVSNGEMDGRTVHPLFEAEWYEYFDRSQVRRGRPVNQLLDFVAHGELGQGGPHFRGQRHLESLGDDPRPPSLLRHAGGPDRHDTATPSSEHVGPVPLGDADRVARERVEAYHADLGRLSARGPVLGRHPTADAPPAGDARCLVVVDERHLVSPDGVAGFATTLRQEVAGLRVVVVEGAGSPRRADVDALVEEWACLDVVQRRDREPIGAVVRRLLEDTAPEAWAEWTPGQHWRPDFLATAVGALRQHPTTGAAAAVSASTPQPWLRTDDALWVGGVSGAGVVLRAEGPHAVLPSTALDLGYVGDVLLGLAVEGSCAVVDQALVRVHAVDDVGDNERRAAANSSRARHLVRFAEPDVEVGVAIPTYEDWRMTLVAVRSVLETVGDHDVRVVVVDNGSRRPVASILAAAFAADDRVVVRRLPRNTDFALGSTVAAAEARGRTTVFLNNDTAPQPGWLDPLLAALDEGAAAVQPLLLYGDRTVQTAGTVFLGGLTMPSHLLVGVHPRDVGDQVDAHPFSALTAACLAVRTEHVRAIGGFDPRFVNGMEDVDLCLRLGDLTGAPLRVRTASRVVHFESRTVGRSDHHDANRDRFVESWAARLRTLDDRAVLDSGPVALDAVERYRFAKSPLWAPQMSLRLRRDPVDVHEPEPRLRWAIKSAATGDLAGDMWGDTFFAASLASALRRLGQDVVVDREPSHNRPSARWDDVTLTLRGLTAFVPHPEAVNLLWVISHPDLVTRKELSSGFSRVYAAGAGWAKQVTRRWGIEVRTLLQATDREKFHPGVDAGPDRSGVLFVGRTRNVPRVIVRDVIAAGGEPDVYGDDGWEQFIDPRFVKGSGIHNDDVPAAYGAAAIVLNDHWADMAEHGFFSNRLFDAAATGARIVSDHVPGIEDLFGAQVQGYDSLDRLAELLTPGSRHWPDHDELQRSAHAVTTHHSFDARARVLLDDALEVLRERR